MFVDRSLAAVLHWDRCISGIPPQPGVEGYGLATQQRSGKINDYPILRTIGKQHKTDRSILRKAEQ